MLSSNPSQRPHVPPILRDVSTELTSQPSPLVGVSFGSSERDRSPAPVEEKSKKKSFSLRRVATLLMIGWSLVSAAIFSRKAVMEVTMKPAAAARLDPSEAFMPWKDNTNVFASTTQDQLAYFYKNYTSQLSDTLDRDDIRSLGEAQMHLEQDGLAGFYRLDPQFPVSTPRPYQAWDKRVERSRYVLFVTGSDEGAPIRNIATFGDSEQFVRQVERLKESLMQNFDINSADTSLLKQPSRTQLEQEIKQLASSIDPDSEVLIYLAAHGDRVRNSDRQLQGENSGLLYLREGECLQENDLKRIVNTHLGHLPNVTIIIDSCYSGSFIS